MLQGDSGSQKWTWPDWVVGGKPWNLQFPSISLKQNSIFVDVCFVLHQDGQFDLGFFTAPCLASRCPRWWLASMWAFRKSKSRLKFWPLGERPMHIMVDQPRLSKAYKGMHNGRIHWPCFFLGRKVVLTKHFWGDIFFETQDTGNMYRMTNNSWYDYWIWLDHIWNWRINWQTSLLALNSSRNEILNAGWNDSFLFSQKAGRFSFWGSLQYQYYLILSSMIEFT